MVNALVLLASAALLANPVANPEPAKPKQKDINRTVCKVVKLSGSHFNKRRVCMSAAEWKNAQQADRDAVEAIQRSTCVSGAGC